MLNDEKSVFIIIFKPLIILYQFELSFGLWCLARVKLLRP